MTDFSDLLRSLVAPEKPASRVRSDRKQGTIDSVQAGPPATVTVAMLGGSVPGLRFPAWYAPAVGDVVWVAVQGGQAQFVESVLSGDGDAAAGGGGGGGAAPTVSVGTVSTGAAGSQASVVDSDASANVVLDFTIPRGDQGDPGQQGIQGIQGIQGPAGTLLDGWQGAWSAGTTYAEGDVVRYDGSSWLAVDTPTVGAMPAEVGLGAVAAPVSANTALWQLNGSATYPDGTNLQLTPATNSQAGNAILKAPIYLDGLTLDFSTWTNASGADGFGIGFLATATADTFLGGNAGDLGIEATTAVGAWFQLLTFNTDTASLVSRQTSGGARTTHQSANLTDITGQVRQWRITSVKVATNSYRLRLYDRANLNTTIIDQTVSVPDSVKLVFGAGTGGLAQQHQIRDVAGSFIDPNAPTPWAVVARKGEAAASGGGGALTWTEPTLTNGWVNFAGGHRVAGYTKSADGMVRLRGLVKNGSDTIFTLPAGFRPSAIELFDTMSNNTLTRVDVEADGRVRLIAGPNSWVSLAGMSFYADQ